MRPIPETASALHDAREVSGRRAIAQVPRGSDPREIKWRARQESNLRPLASETNTLSN